VTPGKPHASSTRLPPELSKALPLRGMVGLSPVDTGCRFVLQTSDKMGNVCVNGGADVTVACEHPDVESSVVDQQDGTSQLQWRSKMSGTFEASVRVNGEQVVGSPFAVQLASSTPEMLKSTLTGPGLKDAIAGIDARVRIGFYDQYSNTAIPNETFRFGLSMLKEKEKLTPTTNEYPHSGDWYDQSAGVYELTYVAKAAGSFELHVWCDPVNKGERLPFPGSPFAVHVMAGKATASKSQVSPEQNGLGWSKESRSVDKHGKQIQTDLNTITAGDSIFVRPQIQDEFGNPTAPPEGGITSYVERPDGEKATLAITEQSRGGVGGLSKFETRYECTQRGQHYLHVQLQGVPIVGSPVAFDVLSAHADPAQCKLIVPTSEVLYWNTTHTIVLETYDKFGNRCNFGGLSTNVRLQLIKQGMHDQTMLMPNNHEVNITDNNDGTYHVDIKTIKIAANIKVIVNMDKNIPAAGGELPAVFLSIVKEDADSANAKGADGAGGGTGAADVSDAPAVEEGQADDVAAAAPNLERSKSRRSSVTSAGRGKKTQKAGKEAEGAGSREERKSTEGLGEAADAPADANGSSSLTATGSAGSSVGKSAT